LIKSGKRVKKIKKFDQEVQQFLFDIDYERGISNTYGTLDFPQKRTRKDVLILTNNKFNNYFKNVKKQGLTKLEILDPKPFFHNIGEMRFLLENICDKIIKKYDYIIVHLLDSCSHTDNFGECRKHNFECSFIAGLMRGFKATRHVDFYLAHESSGKPNLRCSDVLPIDTYNNHNNISNKINQIIKTHIL